MARLYADEQFPREVSEQLRVMGHDVLKLQEAGSANLGVSDEDILAFANERSSCRGVMNNGGKNLVIEESHI